MSSALVNFLLSFAKLRSLCALCVKAFVFT